MEWSRLPTSVGGNWLIDKGRKHNEKSGLIL